MNRALLFFSLAGLVSWLATPVAIAIARRINALDHPEARKVHTRVTPRLGGLAIYLGLAAAGIAAWLFHPAVRDRFLDERIDWPMVFVAATVVFLLGVWDDIRGLSAAPKFLIQVIAASMVIGTGLQIRVLSSPFGGHFELGWAGVPLTLLWIVGVTNAFNLIDGLDGLAAGVALISTSTVFIIAMLQGNATVAFITMVLAGALAGFLFHNFNPARIFLGDSGAFLLGFLLAILALTGGQKKSTAIALMIPILIVGIPVIDTLWAMTRRAFREVFVHKRRSLGTVRQLFQADREHLHHKLLDLGFAHRKAVLVIYFASVVLAAFAVVSYLVNNDRISAALLLAGIVLYFFVKTVGGMATRRGADATDADAEGDL